MSKKATVDRIGDYRLLQLLGEGAAGEVYLATPISAKPFAKPGEPLAIKLYKETILRNRHQKERIQREFKVGSEISHPNLARIYELGGLETGRPYLVMEYIDGMPLSTWVQLFHPLPGTLLYRVVGQIVAGIEVLHTNEIIHRDLKPANVMVSSSFDARIMDFGVVRASREAALTDGDKFLGTIRNSSPELLRGREADERTDLYSLGTILYALLYGEEVFADENQFVRLADHVESTMPDLEPVRAGRDQVCSSLLELTRELLQKDPNARPQNVAEVKTKLEAIRSVLASTPLIVPLHAYVATALTGLSADARWHVIFASSKIADVAKQYGFYVYQPRRATDPVFHKEVEPAAVYALDRSRVVRADLLFVLLNKPSFGVGQELEIAATYGKPTILVMEEGATVSRMVVGSPANVLDTISYSTPEDLEKKLHTALARVRAQVETWRDGAGSKRHRVAVGPRLKEVRILKGYSTSEALAQALGVPTRLIDGIENGQIENVGLQILMAICAALEVEASSFFAGSPVPTPKPDDLSVQRLERLALRIGWSAREFLGLRQDYEREKAASGRSEVLSDQDWLDRKAKHDLRILEESSDEPEARPDEWRLL